MARCQMRVAARRATTAIENAAGLVLARGFTGRIDARAGARVIVVRAANHVLGCVAAHVEGAPRGATVTMPTLPS